MTTNFHGVAFVLFHSPASGRCLWLHRQDGTWGLPGGHVEPGEAPIMAAVRECLEEIGRAPDEGLTRALVDGLVTTYTCECKEFTPVLNAEHSAFVWATPEEMPEPFAALLPLEGPQGAEPAAVAQDRATWDHNGWPTVEDVPISRSGILQYRGANIKVTGACPIQIEPAAVYSVFRPDDELASPETLKSCELIPFTILHGDRLLGPSEAGLLPVEKKGQDGTLGESFTFRDGTLYADKVKLTTDRARDLIASGQMRELSVGWRCEYVYSPGVAPDGQPFDFVQRKLRANHLALVYSGRAGHEVCIALDSVDEPLEVPAMAEPENTPAQPPKSGEGGEQKPGVAEMAGELKEAILSALRADLASMVEEAVKSVAGGGKPPAEKPEESAPAMDAAEVQRQVQAGIKAETERIQRRASLAASLAPHLGDIPAAQDSADAVAEYAIGKLREKGANIPEGLKGAQAVAAVQGYLAAAPSGRPGNITSASAQDSGESDLLKRNGIQEG